MPIDTSSYYPEVPSDSGNGDSYSLNSRGEAFSATAPHPHMNRILLRFPAATRAPGEAAER